MMDPAARLRAAAAAMRAGEPVPDDIALQMADAIDAAIEYGGDLDALLGLRPQSRLSKAAFSRRAALVCQLAQFFDGPPSRVAGAMARTASRYASDVWPRTRHLNACPVGSQGRPEALLWQLHRDVEDGGAAWPLCRRSIFTVVQSSAVAIAREADAQDDCTYGDQNEPVGQHAS